MSPSSKTFTVVGVFSNEIEANAAKGFLESNGIDSFIADEVFNRLYGGTFGITSGGIKLKVCTENADRAQDLLSQDFSQTTAPDADVPESDE